LSSDSNQPVSQQVDAIQHRAVMPTRPQAQEDATNNNQHRETKNVSNSKRGETA
jgi:hypothetical protein